MTLVDLAIKFHRSNKIITWNYMKNEPLNFYLIIMCLMNTSPPPPSQIRMRDENPRERSFEEYHIRSNRGKNQFLRMFFTRKASWPGRSLSPQPPKKVNQRSLVSTHSQNYPLKSPATLSPPLFLCIVFLTILLMSPSDTESHPSTVLAPEVEFHTHQIQGKTTPLHETLPN